MVRVVGILVQCLVIGLVHMHIGTRLIKSQGILVTTVIGFIAAIDTNSSFFYAYSVAIFYCILPYSASHNILSYSACYILPYFAVHILPYSAVDTSRFKRAEDGECVSIIGVCWCCKRVLAGLNSSSGVIIIIIQAIRRKKAISNI